MMEQRIKSLIRDIPDFPRKGIVFKDITPVLKEPDLCADIVDHIVSQLNIDIDAVCAIESRGFYFGTLLANRLQLPFIPIRKEGKLPGDTISYSYDLEYGTSTIEIQDGFIRPGTRVLIHDDLLATGGTAMAAAGLIKLQKSDVVAFSFLVQLSFLEGEQKLRQITPNIHSLVIYDK